MMMDFVDPDNVPRYTKLAVPPESRLKEEHAKEVGRRL
jgi:hypothetical protein